MREIQRESSGKSGKDHLLCRLCCSTLSSHSRLSSEDCPGVKEARAFKLFLVASSHSVILRHHEKKAKGEKKEKGEIRARHRTRQETGGTGTHFAGYHEKKSLSTSRAGSGCSAAAMKQEAGGKRRRRREERKNHLSCLSFFPPSSFLFPVLFRE